MRSHSISKWFILQSWYLLIRTFVLYYTCDYEKSFQRRLVGNLLYYVDEFRRFIEVNNVKISTKGRYGLTIMIELAKQFGEGPVPLRKIASENDLSEAYLEQLVSPLRNSGLSEKCPRCIWWIYAFKTTKFNFCGGCYPCS